MGSGSGCEEEEDGGEEEEEGRIPRRKAMSSYFRSISASPPV